MILEVRKLTKIYEGHPILDSLNWQIKTPQIIALVAPNGTGKTTLLNILTNLESYQKGSIKILGKDLTDRSIFKNIAYMQDNSILYSELTGKEHLSFIAHMYNKNSNDINKVVEKVGMNGYLNKRVGKYSLGMKQHLLFAMSILIKPKLFFLDEPLNGLDPDSVIKVRDILTEMKNNGTTIIFSSHNLEEVSKLTNNVQFLHKGKLKKIQDVVKHQSKWTIIIEDVSVMENFLKKNHISYKIKTSHKIEVMTTAQTFDTLENFFIDNKVKVFDITKKEWDLEQVYLDLFWGNSIESI